jgi:uncharacterized RDD family membrane protein YckC
MENIAIETTQNIAIEQPIASVGERIVAAFIDLAFLCTYMLVVISLGSFSESPVVTVIFSLPALFYHLICEMVMDGQSWGKRIMNIKVVKIDGTQPEFTTYLIRWIFRLVDVLILFGAISTIVIIINGKGQRLGDIAANSTVIRLKEKSVETDIFTTLPDHYTLQYPQVSRLNDRDISTAKEILDFLNESYYSEDAVKLATKARVALEEKMDVHSELKNDLFLKAIVYDYNYIHTR